MYNTYEVKSYFKTAEGKLRYEQLKTPVTFT
jgi:hypothetical protein